MERNGPGEPIWRASAPGRGTTKRHFVSRSHPLYSDGFTAGPAALPRLSDSFTMIVRKFVLMEVKMKLNRWQDVVLIGWAVGIWVVILTSTDFRMTYMESIIINSILRIFGVSVAAFVLIVLSRKR